MGDRPCAWCGGPIPARARRDAKTCSKPCRQARHRVTAAARDGLPRAARDASRGSARRLAYADPPYPGKSALYYRDHPDYAGEVDHGELVSRLATYDGWALSTSSRALPEVLALCVERGLEVRVAVWNRGARAHATARYPVSAWEPVIYAPLPSRPRRATDVLTHGVTPMMTLPGRVIGAKPAKFCRWMFDLIGAEPGDTLDDIFPGSGIVGQAWRAYVSSDAGDVERDASRAPAGATA